MNTRRQIFSLLQAALVAFLILQAPTVGQTTQSNPTSTEVSPQTADSEVNKPQNPYDGMAGENPVRKDAWTWYWNEKAHVDIDTQNTKGFWGNDVVSLFFKGIADNVVVPFWNGAMEYDFIRAGLLLVIAGMLLGFGATLVMPKKPETTK